jgi:type I restriction enzyme S subunit
VLPKYISWYANGTGQRYFFDEGKQTTNLASLNSTKLRQLPIPLPPKEEQEAIVAEMERILSEASAGEVAVGTNIRRLSSLRQAILRWAFEGKLVDQDPNDEPASVLLDRIRAQREASETPPRRNHRR